MVSLGHTLWVNRRNITLCFPLNCHVMFASKIPCHFIIHVLFDFICHVIFAPKSPCQVIFHIMFDWFSYLHPNCHIMWLSCHFSTWNCHVMFALPCHFISCHISIPSCHAKFASELPYHVIFHGMFHLRITMSCLHLNCYVMPFSGHILIPYGHVMYVSKLPCHLNSWFAMSYLHSEFYIVSFSMRCRVCIQFAMSFSHLIKFQFYHIRITFESHVMSFPMSCFNFILACHPSWHDKCKLDMSSKMTSHFICISCIHTFAHTWSHASTSRKRPR